MTGILSVYLIVLHSKIHRKYLTINSKSDLQFDASLDTSIKQQLEALNTDQRIDEKVENLQNSVMR